MRDYALRLILGVLFFFLATPSDAVLFHGAGIRSKCIIHSSISLERLAKGVARHPQTQDAQQQRTETIRFL